MTRGKHGLCDGFTRDEFFGHAALFHCTIAFKRFVQVIIDDEAHVHDPVVIDLANHVD